MKNSSTLSILLCIIFVSIPLTKILSTSLDDGNAASCDITKNIRIYPVWSYWSRYPNVCSSGAGTILKYCPAVDEPGINGTGVWANSVSQWATNVNAYKIGWWQTFNDECLTNINSPLDEEFWRSGTLTTGAPDCEITMEIYSTLYTFLWGLYLPTCPESHQTSGCDGEKHPYFHTLTLIPKKVRSQLIQPNISLGLLPSYWCP